MAKTKAVAIKQNAVTTDAERLIAQAIDKNVPVETMERLLAMRRELLAENAKHEFDEALAKFQSQIPVIEKTKVVRTKTGQEAYKYAPIESIIEQVKKALKINGFSYKTNMELIENGTTKVKVSIKVTHKAGHSEETEMTVPLGTQTNIMSSTQVVAAAQTFAKRYAFCNAFGILTGDEDNDARPQETPELQKNTQQSNTNKKYYVTLKQIQFIEKLVNQKGKTLKGLNVSIKKDYGVEDYKKIDVKEAKEVISKLMALPDKEDKEEDLIDIDEVSDAIDYIH